MVRYGRQFLGCLCAPVALSVLVRCEDLEDEAAFWEKVEFIGFLLTGILQFILGLVAFCNFIIPRENLNIVLDLTTACNVYGVTILAGVLLPALVSLFLALCRELGPYLTKKAHSWRNMSW